MATIFSYQANEEDKDAVGYVDDNEFLDTDGYSMSMAADPTGVYKSLHTRDELEEFIHDYNKQFGTNFTSKDSQSYYNYYSDIAKRVKH